MENVNLLSAMPKLGVASHVIASGVIILSPAAKLYQKAQSLFSAVIYRTDNHHMDVKFPVNWAVS